MITYIKNIYNSISKWVLVSSAAFQMVKWMGIPAKDAVEAALKDLTEAMELLGRNK